MSLLLRLKPMVLAPAIWLSEPEFRARFRRNPRDLLRMLPVDDVVDGGRYGLEAMVAGVSFRHGSTAVCSTCSREKPLTEFSVRGEHIRGQCRECHSIQRRDCDKGRPYVGRA